jgi:hypothetical protein
MSDDEDFFDDEYWEYDDSPNDGVVSSILRLRCVVPHSVLTPT